jgi:hypothetical protein
VRRRHRARPGGAFRPWHYARTKTEQHQTIQALPGQDRGHVLFYVWDRPAGGKSNEYPGHQLKIVYNSGMGAAHYTNGDSQRGPTGHGWRKPISHPPIPQRSSMTPGTPTA